MNVIPKCPKCGSEYTYFDGSLYVCPDCSHEFDSVEEYAKTLICAKILGGAKILPEEEVNKIYSLKQK